MDRMINLNKVVLFLFIFVIFLFEVQLFNIGPDILSNFNNVYQKILIVLISFMGVVVFLNKIANNIKFAFSGYVIFFILFCLLEMIISMYRYNIALSEIFSISNYIFILLAYFLFSLYVNNGNKDQFIDIIMLISLVYSIILLVQYFLFPKYGIILNFPEGVSSRNNLLRITQGESLINIAIVLAFGRILNCEFRFKLLPYATLLIGFSELVIVQKTRMVIICIVITSILLFFCKVKIITKKITYSFSDCYYLFIYYG
ncbi:O-antigen ligase like membrane protein [Niallia nealsonii AAU1]|nr:O-antigen ligase like membrane protein [Niallia nealsonii AAU1]